MGFLKDNKSAVQGISLLVCMASPFAMYLTGQNGWGFALYPLLGLMALAMLAIMLSD